MSGLIGISVDKDPKIPFDGSVPAETNAPPDPLFLPLPGSPVTFIPPPLPPFPIEPAFPPFPETAIKELLR